MQKKMRMREAGPFVTAYSLPLPKGMYGLTVKCQKTFSMIRNHRWRTTEFRSSCFAGSAPSSTLPIYFSPLHSLLTPSLPPPSFFFLSFCFLTNRLTLPHTHTSPSTIPHFLTTRFLQSIAPLFLLFYSALLVTCIDKLCPEL